MEIRAPELTIAIEGIARADMRDLVMEHFAEMIATAAPESSHALDLDSLADPAITLYGARRGDQLIGCGALKELAGDAGEVKTMRTIAEVRGQGIGGLVLDQLIAEAQCRGYHTLWLETGSEDFFEAARTMYRSRGFVECAPFADYRVDPHSIFMMLRLA